MITLVTPPATDVLTLTEAKNHLRVDTIDDDALILAEIRGATGWAEEYLGRQLVTATWRLTLDGWPTGSEILLPRPPVISVTSVVYEKADGTQGTMPAGDYFLDAAAEPGRLILAEGASWPGSTLRKAAAVAVTYQAGYGDPAAVPAGIKVGLKTLIGSLYENRESEVVGTSTARLGHSLEYLLYPYRVWSF